MNTDIFKQHAINMSTKSTYKQRLGAVVVFKGTIVGKGFNKVHSTGAPKFDGLHAEIEALRNTQARYRKGSTVYVCRLTKAGKLALAKPCYDCRVVMRKMGVKYVWYSFDNEWVRMDLQAV